MNSRKNENKSESNSEDEQNEGREEDFYSDLELGADYLQKKIIGKGYKKIFQDIEIQKREFITLLFITFSTSTLGAIALYYSGSLINTSRLFGGTALGAGLFIGIVLSFILIDKIEKKFPVLAFLFVGGMILNAIGITIVYYSKLPTFPIIIFSINAAIFIITLIISIVLFINYTSVLERGRIIALLLILVFLYLLAVALLIQLNFLAIIPGIVPFACSYYLYKYRDEEKTITHFTLFDLEESQRRDVKESIKKETALLNFLKFLGSNNHIIIKYLIVLFAIAMLIGLMIPTEFYSEVLQLEGRELIVEREFLLVSPVFLGVGAFILGLVFDFYGRKSTLSFIILVVGVSNFVSLFQTGGQYSTNQLSLITAVVFSLFLSISLINGELGKSEHYGRSISLFLIVILLGFMTGAIIKEQTISNLLVIYPQIEDRFFSEIRDFISSVIFMLCVFSLFIMANINQPQTAEEQNWPKSLIHLYIIHNSGLLIYEHKFKEEQEFVTADLVSGGLIGLTSMLQEITKDTNKLRVIDHGNKKLLFQWDENDDVVFVLVINRELVILRHKLSQFVRAFEKKFERQMQHFKGVNSTFFEKPCKELVNLFFTRKYFEIIPGITKHFGED